MILITDERCTGYSSPGHPERPARISRTLEKLKSQTELGCNWEKPATVQDDLILRAHDRSLLERVRKAEEFDGDTPAHPDILAHASRSVAGAVAAMRFAREEKPAFSLLRPPGHHATRDQAMGFCYLNGIAIAAMEAVATGTESVAVFDFDVHHGNGTEAILHNQKRVTFTSIHQHPCYPGTGTKDVWNNCFNYPVAPRTPRGEYRKVISRALKKIVDTKPSMIAVSAGFDAYARDPLAQETLEAEDFHWIGQELRKLGIPFFSVLEGGYSNDLPDLILAYLKGVDGR